MARKRTRREFVIIGLDSFGENLALALVNQGHQVLGIDRSREVVQRLADNLQDVVSLDATDPEALATLSVDAFETAVVALGGDLAQAVLVTLTLKDLGVKHVVCEAQSEYDERVLIRVGADAVVTPAIESARSIAYSLTGEAVQAGHLRFANQLAVQWRPPRSYSGSLGELMAHYSSNVQVLLLAGRNVIYNPAPEEPVSASDELLVAGPEADILDMLADGASVG